LYRNGKLGFFGSGGNIRSIVGVCCSRSSLIEHSGTIEGRTGGRARVNVGIDEGGEFDRLKEIEFDNK
jgi:hypothetical protein